MARRAILLALLLSGCASLQPNHSTYYTNPQSPGYAEEVFFGLCERCQHIFKFSASQWEYVLTKADPMGKVPCPYCGFLQDILIANDQYVQMQSAEDAKRLDSLLLAVKLIRLSY